MLHKIITTISISAVLLASCGGNGHTSSSATTADSAVAVYPAGELRSKIAAYITAKQLNIGVGVRHLERGDTLSVNGHEHYAMMSVCKFPQAITLLHLVDSGKLQRNAKVHITAEDLKLPTRSTLQHDHPKVPFDLTIPEALAYSIGQSDNVTSNVIFAMDGGPAAVEAYIHSLGVAEIGVGIDYAHMYNDVLYKNWITPVAAAMLLDKFYTGGILSDSSRTTLWHAMTDGPNGADRLKGLLPDGTVVGHKTGTSGRDSTNATTAFNDIGIMQLPDGSHVAVAVFIAGSKQADSLNSRAVAEIGKMVWDHYSVKQ